jgi:hypothetical protein
MLRCCAVSFASRENDLDGTPLRAPAFHGGRLQGLVLAERLLNLRVTIAVTAIGHVVTRQEYLPSVTTATKESWGIGSYPLITCHQVPANSQFTRDLEKESQPVTYTANEPIVTGSAMFQTETARRQAYNIT